MIICIDPGHGGSDPGATGHGLKEADINLKIATFLQRQLESYPAQHKVVMTRDSDKFISLRDRAEISDKAGAALFVSIHCNASENSSANGFEVFHCPGSTKGTAWAVKVHSATRSLYQDDRGVKEASFSVLKHTDAPAILIECGFISNEKEAKLLGDERFQLSVAKAIASAIR
jgi:N-acetylmuramoyl-L-alanine amidase